jgi:hypothetical protein
VCLWSVRWQGSHPTLGGGIERALDPGGVGRGMPGREWWWESRRASVAKALTHALPLRPSLPPSQPPSLYQAQDRYGERAGGYCRVLRTLPRKGDNAPMAILELV